MDFLFHHMLETSRDKYPDAEAVVFKEQRLTYDQLWANVQQTAARLIQEGVNRNDRVGVMLTPSIPLVETLYAISLAGGVFVPIHHNLLDDQVSHILSDCDVRLLITQSSQLEKIEEHTGSAPLKVLLADDEIAEKASDQYYRQLGKIDDEIFRRNAVLHDRRTENDLGAILYTSGSTGMPKGVMLSHRNLNAGASIVSEYLSISHQDRILAALPFTFDAGLNQLTTAIQQGGTIVLIHFLFAREIVRALNQERITGLAGVPPLWNLITHENSTLEKNCPSTLRYVTNTGGAMSEKLLMRMQQTMPNVDIVLMYGLTEAFRSTYLPPDQLEKRSGSMGKSIPNTDIFLVDEQNRLCAPGEPGELVHRGPTVCMGYWGQPDATSKVFRPDPFADGNASVVETVVYSGDLVKMDDDGYFYFVGRKDNQIKTSGFRVSPTEVEKGIMRSNQVEQVAVVGLADEILGQRIHAFVIHNHQEFSLDELTAKCAEHLPRHMIPKTWSVVDQFPKTSSGKVDYPRLKLQAETDSSAN